MLIPPTHMLTIPNVKVMWTLQAPKQRKFHFRRAPKPSCTPTHVKDSQRREITWKIPDSFPSWFRRFPSLDHFDVDWFSHIRSFFTILTTHHLTTQLMKSGGVSQSLHPAQSPVNCTDELCFLILVALVVCLAAGPVGLQLAYVLGKKLVS